MMEISTKNEILCLTFDNDFVEMFNELIHDTKLDVCQLNNELNDNISTNYIFVDYHENQKSYEICSQTQTAQLTTIIGRIVYIDFINMMCKAWMYNTHISDIAIENMIVSNCTIKPRIFMQSTPDNLCKLIVSSIDVISNK